MDKHTGRLSPHTSLRGPASLTCQHNTNFPSERVLTRDQGPREEQTNGTAEFFYKDTTVSYRYYVCLLIGVTSRQFASDCKLHGVMYVGPTDETKKWRSGDAVLQFVWLLLLFFCFVFLFFVFLCVEYTGNLASHTTLWLWKSHIYIYIWGGGGG